jgi:molybdate transport system substrate-binding protein
VLSTMKFKSMLLALVVLFGCASPPSPTEVLVAAASDLNFPVREIIAGFERQTGHTVKLSLGSSGNFYAQIANGAPFDVFLSADITYPQKLEESDLTEPGSIFVYGIGRIVVWARNDSPLDFGNRGIQTLVDPAIHKIAIANPQHAPYGRAAVSSMQHFEIYEAVKSKLVLGENISQTAQLVQSGAADAGIIALSLAVGDTMKSAGSYWEIPLESYPKIEQGAVILKQARNAGHLDGAQAFMETLKSPEGQTVLKKYGFFLPGRDEPAQ